MHTVVFNKLVRDKIPFLIHRDNGRCSLAYLSGRSFDLALREKLREESVEFQADKNLEEMADLEEVILAILGIHEIPKVRSYTLVPSAEQHAKRIDLMIKDFLDHENKDQLFDILYAIQQYALVSGSSVEELEKTRLEKLERKGGFTDGVYIAQVIYH